MDTSATIDELANEIRAARDGQGSRFALLLGSGFAGAAGVPGPEEVALATFNELYAKAPALVKPYLSEDLLRLSEHETSSRDRLTEAFYRYICDQPTVERRSLVREYYLNHPIPEAYRELSRFITNAAIPIIVYTGIDTLLEATIDLMGLRRNRDYLAFDPFDDPSCACPLPEADRSALSIVKLHSRFGIANQGEVRSFLNALESQYRLVVVGYADENSVLTAWLDGYRHKLWFVSQHRPQQGRFVDAKLRFIQRDDAGLGEFFGSLSAALQPPAVMQSVALPEGSWATLKSRPTQPLDIPAPQIAAPISAKAMNQAKQPEFGLLSGTEKESAIAKPPPSVPVVEPESPGGPPSDIRPVAPQPDSDKAPLPGSVDSNAPSDARTILFSASLPSPKLTDQIGSTSSDLPGAVTKRPVAEPVGILTVFPTAVKGAGDSRKDRRQGQLLVTLDTPQKQTSLDLVEAEEALREHRRADALRRQIRESQSILASLEQRALRGGGDARLAAEMAHQREQVTSMRKELDGLSIVRKRILRLMGEIVDAIASIETEDGTAARYARSQLAAVRDEYDRQNSNGDVIAAAIGGLIILAGRLGTDFVDRMLVDELGSLMPGS
jgi:hypothetical protein